VEELRAPHQQNQPKTQANPHQTNPTPRGGGLRPKQTQSNKTVTQANHKPQNQPPTNQKKPHNNKTTNTRQKHTNTKGRPPQPPKAPPNGLRRGGECEDCTANKTKTNPTHKCSFKQKKKNTNQKQKSSFFLEWVFFFLRFLSLETFWKQFFFGVFESFFFFFGTVFENRSFGFFGKFWNFGQILRTRGAEGRKRPPARAGFVAHRRTRCKLASFLENRASADRERLR